MLARGNFMSRSTGNLRASSRARPERLEVRVSRDQKALFQRAADLQGKTLREFVVSNLKDGARRTIAESQSVRLNAVDSRAFAEALINPRAPNRNLRNAAARYMKLIGK
jgi:uncharacterized protein (DUF1778 family)